MPVEDYCLGLEALGRCVASSEPLLSIGEGVAIAALLLGFYRFSPRLVQMRWHTRGISEKTVFTLVCVALGLVFVGAALRLFGPPWTRTPVVGYAAAWEIAAGVLLAITAIVLGAIALRPARLKPRSAAQYLAGNQDIIAGGFEPALRELGREIEPGVAVVTAHCRDYRDRSAREGPLEADAYTRACFALLELWSDARFCNALVCGCPDTVTAVVKALTAHAVHGDGAPLGAELVNQAFADERSMLYAEARVSGLRRQKTLLKSMFGDWDLVDSAVRPLASWNVYRDGAITERKVQRWADAVESALGTFLENGKHGEAVFRMRQGLETLNQLCTAVLAARERRAAPWVSVHDQIFEIASAFRTIVKRIRTSNLPVPVETTVENYDPLQDETLHGAVAEELFNFFGLICGSADHEFLDWISMGPWKELFEEGELTNNLRALQVRVAYHVTLKVDDNLDPRRRFLPAITRMLLVRYPLAVLEHNPKAVIAKDLEGTFVAALEENFPRLWKEDRAFAAQLLPDNVDYDEAKGVLRVRHPRRETQTFQLARPHDELKGTRHA
jgi:uncharacterized membrane protein (DUF485 family)